MTDFTPEFFESIKASITAPNGKIEYLNEANVLPELFEQRHVVCRLPVEPKHMNHVGMVYAGSFFIIAESTGASLLKCTYGSKYVAIIKNATLDYLKPAKSDLVVDLSMTEEEAKARIAYVEEHGKGQYPMDIPVKDANGELCANVHITYYLMPNRA